MFIAAWIILALVILAALFGLVSYNRLVTMRQQCNQAFADIDVLLRQRHDLVPNQVETVKGYAGHERGTLDAVVQARNAATAAPDPAAKAQAETALGGALRQLFAVAEAYPELKANSNFLQLQRDLSGVESSSPLRAALSMIQQFPTALFAPALGFTPHEFFNPGDERQANGQAPQAKF